MIYSWCLILFRNKYTSYYRRARSLTNYFINGGNTMYTKDIEFMENILNELFNIQNEIDEILETEELDDSTVILLNEESMALEDLIEKINDRIEELRES